MVTIIYFAENELGAKYDIFQSKVRGLLAIYFTNVEHDKYFTTRETRMPIPESYCIKLV